MGVGLAQAEPLMTLDDLLILSPPPSEEPPSEAAPTGKGAPKAKKGPAVAEPPPDPQPPTRPEIVSAKWKEKISTRSAVRGAVSTAHRLLVSERDSGLHGYCNHMLTLINENKLYYGKILQQEDSWNERWQCQVEMLKQGNL